ncbi:TATA element modulatory factor isoform X2 [Hippocampus zosterae]|uniref:TATA element modulatory factor isoform X2 n=1 Tax=Hippocampus zosterae TaxID=109293 RepID=UPI00223DD11A|nr:TATA element modulatory factor isoform X2 [Hippocampus zosterae]
MSWFNASHLSTFAKQALTTAQKSIDRVLDIKEESQWSDTTLMPYEDVTLPEKLSLSGGWGITQWEAPPEEKVSAPAPSVAITTPVTRTVVDESENFFSAFLPPGDGQCITTSQVVSVAPAKSQKQPRAKEKNRKNSAMKEEVETQKMAPADSDRQHQTGDDGQLVALDCSHQDTILPQPVSPSENCGDLTCSPDDTKTNTTRGNPDSVTNLSGDSNAEWPQIQTEYPVGGNPSASSEPAAVSSQSKDARNSDPPASQSSKDVHLEQKDLKTEDRQSDTPSPPVSAFSSGTSTTSDIEVLDHESVLSESSASSRQETGEGKSSLHLMHGSFQLLSTSACGDFPRLEDYPKLTESCGSSSDAFERIDSFSVQSLDSRSVSEINSDDEIPGNRTLASVTSAATLSADAPSDRSEKQGGGLAESTSELQEEKEEYLTGSLRKQSVDEMEESGRSVTPVNCEQPEQLAEIEHDSGADVAQSDLSYGAIEELLTPIAEETKGVSTIQVLELQKVINELSSRLEKREAQLLAVSKDKAGLEEQCDNLRDDVLTLKEESTAIQSLKDEFTQRIADTERKAQLACKERDIAKKEIKGLREELASRLHSSVSLELIKEKEEQIRGLLEEGEKLSKQQLQHSNIIKKLRAKEKDSEARLAKQQRKMKDLEEELGQLRQVLEAKEEVEKQHRDNIKKLNSAVERQEKEQSRLQTDSEELLEKNRSLQAALDNAYKELAELHKTHASRASEAEEAALSREMKAKELQSLALEKAQEEARTQRELLANQVGDLRLALQRAEQQQARKEDYLRDEISELQQRLQEAESRNQELSESVTSATRPLLRQIENLQASLGGQTASWEKLEQSISDRLVEAQAQLAAAVEKERAATEDSLSVKCQLASLESQNSLLRQEKVRLLALVEAEKSRREKLEDESSREHIELENLRGQHSRVLEEAKKEKLLLTNQLEMEKMKVEQEKKKHYLAQEALKEKRSISHDPPASSTPSPSRSGSTSGADVAALHCSILSQEDSSDQTMAGGTMSVSMSGTNLYEAARLSGGSSVVENMQSQLKLREGEIAQLQLEISSLERSRSVMAEELVRLTNLNEDMQEQLTEISKLRIQLKDLEQRHNTILQMYGEKAEEAEELRLDLEDVKSMFKTQIDELLKNQK